MKTVKGWIGVWILCLLGLASCTDDEVELVDPGFKKVQVTHGGEIEIPILATEWKIESVQETTSGQAIADKNNAPLALDSTGTVEAANGWLALTRDANNRFLIHLKENFDQTNKRMFTICISGQGDRDYVSVTQSAGREYEIVQTSFEEIKDRRDIYTSNEGCTDITFKNNTSEAVRQSDKPVFEKIVASSTFESDDYGAFDWMPEGGVKITAPELMIDGMDYGSVNNSCVYKEGTVTTPYNEHGSFINSQLVPPDSTLNISGKVTYCKRVCKYTLTIHNVGTNSKFDVKGIWTQVVPLHAHVTFSKGSPE